MTTETMLALLKMRLGIASTSRDTFLIHLIDATIVMLDKEKGLEVDLTNELIAGFIINYSVWVYESKGEMGGMPRHLQFALHNLMIHNLKVVDESV